MHDRFWDTVTAPRLNPNAGPNEIKLHADMLPPSTHNSNLRGILSWSQWARLSSDTSYAAGGVCEICGEQSFGPHGKSQRPDCHELWVFERGDGVYVQRLERLIALCKACHAVQHAGLAATVGTTPMVLATLQRVNGWTRSIADADLRWAESRYEIMESLEFDLDVSALLGRINIPGYPTLLIPAAEREALGLSRQEKSGVEPGSAVTLFDVGTDDEDESGGKR